jgi:hypothetical protein
MAGANSNIQIADLDFNQIKNNFKNYLQAQSTFKDYNFEGSALSTLLDILAYNTQYNSFYLNMVANEMFLDSAILRPSVVSHAKVLNYVPKSASGAVALIDLSFSSSGTTFTLPQYTNFISGVIDGVNYKYVTTDSTTVPVVNGTATVNNVQLKQGTFSTYSFTVDSTSNPQYIFEIPDSKVDTSTLKVSVQQSSSNTSYRVFYPTTNYLSLTPTDAVYFIQEATNGNYQIYFGDGVLGLQLTDGNVVKVNYISTAGSAGGLANTFTLMDNVGSTLTSLKVAQQASQGTNKESIASIQFQAPKAFAAQGRAVTKNDYITAIQQNSLGYSFDAVNVWGGEENKPPVYGQVYICLKPSGSYDLTTSQKQQLLSQVIKPISVLTVTPNIVDPDYTYLQLAVTAYYNKSQTNLSPSQLQSSILNSIRSFTTATLNTFNSTFNAYGLLSAVQNTDRSIVTSEYVLKAQKKFYPNLSIPTTYTLNYNTPLQRGTVSSGITSSPDMKFLDSTNKSIVISGVYLEEVLTETYGIDSISVVNPGFNYQLTPTVTILGDGTGATANVSIVNGRINAINVINSGNNYTSAIVVIKPQSSDSTGQSGSAIAVLQGQYGTLRTYYYANTTNGQLKTVLDANAGTIDYINGIITLNSLNPYIIDNPLGQLTVSVTPKTSVISSTFNGIITSDPFDSNAISVNVVTLSS